MLSAPCSPRSKASRGQVLLPAFFILTLLFCAGAQAQAAEHIVHSGESIAAAIAAADKGDVVRVLGGEYHENLRIDKPLSLIGVDRPIVRGGMTGDVVRVTSPDVTIEGFIIADSGADLGAQNAGIYIQPGADRAVVRNCDFSYTLFGLWIEGVADVRIEDNLITGKRDLSSVRRGNGIELYNTQGAQIIGNQISFTRDGIYVDVSHHALFRNNKIHDARYGTHYMNSNENTWEGNEVYHNRGGLALMEVRDQTVRHNRVWGNTDHGIMLRTIQDSTVEGNYLADNVRGLFVYDAEYNTLRNNTIVHNRVGVHLWGGSIHNEVEGNDFVGNQEQVRYTGTRDETWGAKEGNYWSNYLGWDRDGDGIGDVPYVASDLVDRLTWRYPMFKLLLASPAVQTLRLVSQQFPVLRAPSVVDPKPHMRPEHDEWNIHP
ncbi:MAG: nitrous oxide reductase family maturation protein NosD [Rhodanobacter sp.]|nr:nitrous oxide reductase family maturation protein NosD [Rhodanobacter sp.]